MVLEVWGNPKTEVCGNPKVGTSLGIRPGVVGDCIRFGKLTGWTIKWNMTYDCIPGAAQTDLGFMAWK